MKTSYQGNLEKCARAVGLNLSISHKVSYEIANAIRGKDVKKAIIYLENVIAMKQAVPYKRHNFDVGHKPGKIAAGRFPMKAATEFLRVLKGAVSNAVDLGLNGESLKLVHVSSSHGAGQWHYGRQRRRQMKSTNMELVVMEVAEVKKDLNAPYVKKVRPKKVVKETIAPIDYIPVIKKKRIFSRTTSGKAVSKKTETKAVPKAKEAKKEVKTEVKDELKEKVKNDVPKNEKTTEKVEGEKQ